MLQYEFVPGDAGLSHQLPGQFCVQAVARPIRDDVGQDFTTRERQVTYHVEHFVPYAFVIEAQRVLDGTVRSARHGVSGASRARRP